MPETPAYLRIAGDLRAAILSGALEPGAKLPSETKLMAQYGVSRTVAKWAVSVLKGEGIVEGRRGSGTFVRSVPRLVRHAHGRGPALGDRAHVAVRPRRRAGPASAGPGSTGPSGWRPTPTSRAGWRSRSGTR